MSNIVTTSHGNSIGVASQQGVAAVDWDELNGLIGQIYECALNPEIWNATLASIVEALCPVEWRSALILSENKSEKRANCTASVDMTDVAINDYSKMFAVDNPYSQLAWPVRAGTMFDSNENAPRDIVKKSSFYTKFLEPLGYSRVVALKLDHRSEEITFIAFLGPDGCAMARLKRGLRILTPHLQRAIRVSRRIAGLQTVADAKQLAADRSPFATLTLDRGFAILASAGRVRDYVDRGIIAVQHDRLAFCNPVSQRRLTGMFDLPSQTSQAFMAIDKSGRECPVLATRIPEHTVAALGGNFVGASLMVSIGQSSGEQPVLEINHLVQWYGLTPKQGQLAAALAAGHSLQEYAASCGIQLNTVRFQLKAVFSKTGTTSQGELIALLARLPF